MLMYRQCFCERSGDAHEVSVVRERRETYRVSVDGEFYSTHDSMADALTEVDDITDRWSLCRPI